MPELPEVEIARRQFERWLGHDAICAIEVLDPDVVRAPTPLDARALVALSALVGRRLVAARRTAKLLQLDFGDLWLLIHFRMTGKLLQGRHSQSRLVFHGADQRAVSLVDPRRLGWVALTQEADARYFVKAQHFGPEPFPAPLDPDVLGDRLRLCRRGRIRDALLDQTVVAGLGNIAVTEVLWRARVHPNTKPTLLSPGALEDLAGAMTAHVQLVLDGDDSEAIRYVNERGAPNPFLVYGREGQPCPRCAAKLIRLKTGGRSTFVCEPCQTRSGRGPAG